MSIRYTQLTVLATEYTEPQSQDRSIKQAVSDQLGLNPDELKGYTLRKESLDARKKSHIVYRLHIDLDLWDPKDEKKLLGQGITGLTEVPPETFHNPLEGMPLTLKKPRHPPVIVGTGPAGILAALTMARAGIPCVLLERGEAVEQRMRTTHRLRRLGVLNPESNFCFGEGGAGTFSDGKLTCGRNHPLIKHVFQELVRFGAPPEILYEAHPHVGTDLLMRMTKRMREHLLTEGFECHFQTCLDGWDYNRTSEARFVLRLRQGASLKTDHVILAIGHSARDTYARLHELGVAMVPKPFAMGVRIEHPQSVINAIQFGASCPLTKAAEYKLVAHAGDRGVWTFCMCPGGHLLPTSAQEGHLAINGMSYHARKSGFANAALVVNILKDDFFKGHVLDGVRFQETLEKAAFQQGGGGYTSPAQGLEDFLKGRPTKKPISSTYKPGVAAARLDRMLPPYIVEALRAALKEYDSKMRGFITPEAFLAGIESKTSAPVAMPRHTDTFASLSHPGLYPCGEGAGFAGGIVSAALDGVRVAQGLLHTLALEGG